MGEEEVVRRYRDHHCEKVVVSGAEALIISASLFSYALVLHVVTWRIQPPHQYLFWFLKYWLVLPLAVVGAYLAVEGVLRGLISSPEILTWLGGFLTYLALCACFILVYPAISMSSLSLEILHHLRRHGPQAIGSLRLADQSGTAMLETRRNNLLNSGMFKADGESLVLTAKGRMVASAIDTVRWALAIPRGSGG
jgi:hypothetical protein